MWSVDATRARSVSAAVILILLATPLLVDTRPAAFGDDKVPAKALPAELFKAIRDGDLKAVRAQLDTGVDVNARDADGDTPILQAAVYAGPGPDCIVGGDWRGCLRPTGRSVRMTVGNLFFWDAKSG